MFRKILCPIDFSPSSQQAMRVASRLATSAGADLELVHSWHLPAIAYSIEAPYPASVIDEMLAAEENLLAAAVREATALGATKLTSRLERGLPADRVCALAEADPRCDLVVMGTHGRTGIRRLMLGSVAEKVMRHAPCSVLAVRGREGSDAFRHILVPIDFSPGSRHAVDLAAELAARDGAGIMLLHVREPPISYAWEPALVIASDLDQSAAKLLAEWTEALRAKVSVPVQTRTLTGNPTAQILDDLDQDITYDLVVVGSHGLSSIARILLGSVADRIVRHAPCPVLVARSRPA